MVSLREAFGWMNSIPSAPPVQGGRTILVAGLETVIETLPPQDAEFLSRRIRLLLIDRPEPMDGLRGCLRLLIT